MQAIYYSVVFKVIAHYEILVLLQTTATFKKRLEAELEKTNMTDESTSLTSVSIMIQLV